jgi:23S rRNA pseudouridine955/2504/2580 synthase
MILRSKSHRRENSSYHLQHKSQDFFSWLLFDYTGGGYFIKTIIINRNDAGQRLDKFLSKTFENLPPSELFKSVRTKKIKVNGKRAEIGYKLRETDVVDLYVRDEFLLGAGDDFTFKNLKPDLKIIYEDENILLADKKAGILVHPDDREEINTLINHITAYLYQKGEYQPHFENSFAPALCNRIDRNTGGIVICAKNAEALRVINRKIKENETEKKYLCLVHGIMQKKQAVLSAYHKKNADGNTVKIADNQFPGSKPIKTKFNVLREKNNISLVEVELLTGRTHQIRAHFAHIGHPLVGDGKYCLNQEQYKSDRKRGFFSQALYSYKITFKHGGSADCLSYLNGRTFAVDADNIGFAREFQK